MILDLQLSKKDILLIKKLFELVKLNDHNLDKIIEDQMIEKLEIIAPNIDGIIVSDFAIWSNHTKNN